MKNEKADQGGCRGCGRARLCSRSETPSKGKSIRTGKVCAFTVIIEGGYAVPPESRRSLIDSITDVAGRSVAVAVEMRFRGRHHLYLRCLVFCTSRLLLAASTTPDAQTCSCVSDPVPRHVAPPASRNTARLGALRLLLPLGSFDPSLTHKVQPSPVAS